MQNATLSSEWRPKPVGLHFGLRTCILFCSYKILMTKETSLVIIIVFAFTLRDFTSLVNKIVTDNGGMCL